MAVLRNGTGALGIWIHSAGLDKFNREHCSTTSNITDGRVIFLHRDQGGQHHGFNSLRATAGIFFFHPPNCSEGARASYRVAAVGSTEATGVYRIHDVGPAGNCGKGEATGDAFCGGY